MATRVDASTIAAGQLFSTSLFQIPDFQRTYSWTTEKEVSEFWTDLSSGIDSPPYFLGLLIATEEQTGVKTVVDGQQRLTTLTLLANAVRKAASARGKHLIADSMRDLFLFSLDYESEQRIPRIRARADADRSALDRVLDPNREAVDGGSRIEQAQRYLDKCLLEDLESNDASSRLAEWAKFLTSGLVFALFEHPDRNAAFKVYEVVNTRGKDLTPAELIKSYLISSVPESIQQSVYEKWTELEKRFDELRASSQFTQFVRHVSTLSIGYVLPRDLYQEINFHYVGQEGVSALLGDLEGRLPTYTHMVDPSTDSSDISETVSNAFVILEMLALRTVRPVFLAASSIADADQAVAALLRTVVLRSAMGTFGTGSVERQFADAAKQLAANPDDWDSIVDNVKQTLAPTRRAFEQRVRESGLPKSMVHVLRSSLQHDSVTPELVGYPHQIRPVNGEGWENFDHDVYRQWGNTVGNYLLLSSERRPRNTHTPEGAEERLLPLIVEDRLEYLKALKLRELGESDLESFNDEIASRLGSLWFDAE